MIPSHPRLLGYRIAKSWICERYLPSTATLVDVLPGASHAALRANAVILSHDARSLAKP